MRALEVLHPETCSFLLTITSLSRGSSTLGDPLELSSLPSTCCGWLLPFTADSFSVSGQLPGEPEQPQRATPSAPAGNLSLLVFFSVFRTWELRGMFLWKSVPGSMLSSLHHCHLQTLWPLSIFSFSASPLPFRLLIPVLSLTIPYSRFEIIDN